MSATHGKKGIIYKWNGTANNLAAEVCTESGVEAQITDSAKRLLNPNCADLVFTDSGGKNVLRVDHLLGKAIFDGNVAAVTVSGTSAYIIPGTNLVKTGYLYDWKLTPSLALSEATVFQSDWKSNLPGLAEAEGSAEGYFVGSNWFDDIEDVIDKTMQYFLLQLFTYDPDDDQTGDHFNAWVLFNNFNPRANIGEVVKETIGFKVHGLPALVPNA